MLDRLGVNLCPACGDDWSAILADKMLLLCILQNIVSYLTLLLPWYPIEVDLQTCGCGT